ncbi:hypothetical protein V6Z12_D05G279600 [Gossypium hirsutum]|uniref:Nucleobase-ascorbate transporter 3 n=1 Tax=Gossypium hirsutum TaxID=3635 RepID=A0ABM3A6A2_GOSHI|nr:nucleobase-ascorbate transporter 3-like [Gossypium hirsutum]
MFISKGPTWTPAEQLHRLQYCIHSNPSWPQALLLAFQHYIVNLGTTVLIANTFVYRMGGHHGDKAWVIQVLSFMSGINTLLQTLIGSRLPTVMGASFAYTLPLLSIINDYTDEAFTSEHDLPLFHCQYLPPYTAFYWASSLLPGSHSPNLRTIIP